MDVDKYLKHINSSHLREVSFENLTQLQENHIKSVPFENIDFHMNKKILFSLEDSYNRIINRSRGGYCLQLNPLFNWLLRELGYDCYLVSVHVYNRLLQGYSRLPIHVINIVKINSKKYFVDVGTMRVVKTPIELNENLIQKTRYGSYRFIKDAGSFYRIERKKNGDDVQEDWIPQIKFSLEPAQFENLNEMNEYVQTPEHLINYTRTLVSKYTNNSLIQLIGFKFIEYQFYDNSERIDECNVTNEEGNVLIRDRFGIILEEPCQLKDDLKV